MHALGTKWHGCWFRSRLEARWASVFEAMGIDWEYEPDGVELDEGVGYLPDFLLHGVGGENGHEYIGASGVVERDGEPGDVWVEVKGKMDGEGYAKVTSFFRERPILLAMSLPSGGTAEEIEGEVLTMCSKWPYPLSSMASGEYGGGGALLAVGNDGFARIVGVDGAHGQAREWDEKATVLAYRAGCYARFEHGDTPELSDEFAKCRERVALLREPMPSLYSEFRLELVMRGIELARNRLAEPDSPAMAALISSSRVYEALGKGNGVTKWALGRETERGWWDRQLSLLKDEIRRCKDERITSIVDWVPMASKDAKPVVYRAMVRFFDGDIDLGLTSK